MTFRNLLVASSLVAVSFFGGQARAAFTITTTLDNASPAPAGFMLTFAPNPLNNAPAPTPSGGVSYNFVNINYAGSTFTGMGNFTVSGTLMVNNNGVTGSGTFTEMLSYNVVNGFGNLNVVSSSITAGPIAGVSFAPIFFAAPSIQDGTASMGNLSTIVTAAAVVPEPASVVLLGLGLTAAGVTTLRRRRVA